jgi:hypothetical protein
MLLFIIKVKLTSKISRLPYYTGEICTDFFSAEINSVKYMKCILKESTKSFAYRRQILQNLFNLYTFSSYLNKHKF